MQTDTNVATATDKTQQPARAALYALPDILARGSFSKSHMYNLVARGHFPQPCLRMGPRFTRWSSTEVDAFFDAPAAWIAANAGGPTA
jgi:predicted DNA-binding transcriptional regulator AlpA